MKNYNTTPAERITGKPNFDEVLKAYEVGREEQKRVERTLIALFSLVCFLLITYVQLSDIQKSMIISKFFIVGQTIETFFIFIVTL